METELVYWDSNPNPGRTEAFTIAGTTYAADKPFRFRYVPVGIDGYPGKVLEAWKSGRGPDLVDVWPAWVPALKDGLQDLGPFLEAWPEREHYDPSHLDLSRSVDGIPWFLACDLFIQGTHYRRDLVEAAGLEDPRELDRRGEWTLEAFTEYARTLHDPGNGITGLTMRGGQGAELTPLNLMVSANNGRLFDEKGTCLLDSPEAVRALRDYVALAHPLRLSQPGAATEGYREFAWRFYEGKAALMLHNDDASKAVQNRYLGPEKYGSCRLPSTTGDPWVGLAGFGLGAARHSPLAAEAARYVLFFVEHYGQHLNLGTRASGEARTQSADCRPMRPWPARRNPFLEPFRDILEKRDRLYPLPWGSPDFGRIVQSVLQPDLSRLLSGDDDPAETAARWARELTGMRGPVPIPPLGIPRPDCR